MRLLMRRDDTQWGFFLFFCPKSRVILFPRQGIEPKLTRSTMETRIYNLSIYPAQRSLRPTGISPVDLSSELPALCLPDKNGSPDPMLSELWEPSLLNS